MLGRVALGLGLVLLFAGGVSAGPHTLGSELKAQYDWRVLVQVKPHPTLNSNVRGQLLKDLKSALTSAVGDDLGTVEVIDLATVPKEKWEPLWTKWDQTGWVALEDPAFRKLTGVKTHFLKVQVKDGKYLLESRQHDGSTGLPTPRLRSITVLDLDKLARDAGLMMWHDFGPVGTVEPLPENKTTCLIRFRGGELPGFERWVRPGDVFGVSVIREVPRPQPKDARPTARRPGQKEVTPTDQVAQPWQVTLLRVRNLPKPGIAQCEVITARPQPLPDDRQVIGYRAMKLAARDRPVAIKLVDKNNRPPAATVPLEVWAADNGFRDKPTPSDTLAGRNGVFTSGRGLRGVACVTAKLGTSTFRFVVPVLDGGPHVIPFEFDESKVRVANFENEVERFQYRVIDSRLAQEELFIAMRKLIDKQQNREALDRATNGLKTAEADDTTLSAELKRLQDDPLAKEETIRRALASCEQLLGVLRQGKPELENSVASLKTAIARANNPAEFEREFKANELVRQIKYHERRGEVPEALELYDQLFELTKQENVKAQKAKLEEEWKVKSPQQEQARKYITEDWAKLTTLDEIKGGVAKLKESVDQLISGQDRLGLRLTLTGLRAGYARLSDVVNALDPELVQDKEQIQVVKAVRDDLQKIEEAAQAEVNKLDARK